MYDISNRRSFDSVKGWLQEVRSNSHDCLQISLLGNKCDLRKSRQVSEQEGEELAEKMELSGYFEVSARENIGVEDSFLVSA